MANRPTSLYKTTLAVSDVSGVTIGRGAVFEALLALDGFGLEGEADLCQAHPAKSNPANNSVNGAYRFISTVKHLAAQWSIHVSVRIVSLCS